MGPMLTRETAALWPGSLSHAQARQVRTGACAGDERARPRDAPASSRSRHRHPRRNQAGTSARVCVRACANARARLPGALQPCMHAFFLRRGGAVPLGVQATRVVG